MNNKTTVDNLAKEVAKSLKDFAGTTEEAVAAGVDETSKEAVKKLRAAKPSGSGDYSSWDEYDAGWTYKKTKGKKGDVMSTIHNAKKYRLTHLLEKGHAKVNGGRTRAFPHIAPVAEEAETELLDNIKRRI